MFNGLYERSRLWWRVKRAERRAAKIESGEIEIPLLPFIVPHKLSIDVGANKGTLTCLLSKISSNVIAYEANPKLFNKLNQAIGDTVDLREKAVSSKNEKLTFSLGRYRTFCQNTLGTCICTGRIHHQHHLGLYHQCRESLCTERKTLRHLH